MVPVRGPEVRQLSHASAGKVLQNNTGDGHGKDCVAHKVPVLRIPHCWSDLAGNGAIYDGQRGGEQGISRHDVNGRLPAVHVHDQRLLQLQLAGGAVQELQHVARGDDVRRQYV